MLLSGGIRWINYTTYRITRPYLKQRYYSPGEVNFGRTCFVSLLATFKKGGVSTGEIPPVLNFCFSFWCTPAFFFISFFFLHSVLMQYYLAIALLALVPFPLHNLFLPALSLSLPRRRPPDLFSHLLRSDRHLPLTDAAVTQLPSAVLHFPNLRCNISVWQRHAISALHST